MNIGLKTFLAAGLGMAILQGPAQAADEKAAATFKDDREKASYGIGMYFGNQVKRSSLDVDMEVVIAAMKDVVAGKEMKLTDQQGSEAIRTYQTEARKKQAEKNKKEGEAFLAENK